MYVCKGVGTYVSPKNCVHVRMFNEISHFRSMFSVRTWMKTNQCFVFLVLSLSKSPTPSIIGCLYLRWYTTPVFILVTNSPCFKCFISVIWNFNFQALVLQCKTLHIDISSNNLSSNIYPFTMGLFGITLLVIISESLFNNKIAIQGKLNLITFVFSCSVHKPWLYTHEP